MNEWIKARREYLVEQIPLLEKHVTKLEKIDLSNLDDLNKENTIRAIEDSRKLTVEYSDQLRLIDLS